MRMSEARARLTSSGPDRPDRLSVAWRALCVDFRPHGLPSAWTAVRPGAVVAKRPGKVSRLKMKAGVSSMRAFSAASRTFR